MLTTLGWAHRARGLTARDAERAEALVGVLSANEARNRLIDAYYEGDVSTQTLGVAVPEDFECVDVSCAWPEIAVSDVVERSVFDGFVFGRDAAGASARMGELSRASFMASAYARAVTSQMKYGPAFAVVGRGPRGPYCRWHTAKTACALWDPGEGRDECGLVVTGTRRLRGTASAVACRAELFVPEGVWRLELSEDGEEWSACFGPDAMGRPRIVSMVHMADAEKPYGHSRINRKVRAITQSVMRTNLCLEVAAEFASVPQKYVLGLSKRQFDEVRMRRWQYAIGAVLFGETNEEGQAPVAGQFPQVSLQTLLDKKRSLAADFCAATCVPISDLALSDSVYTSSQALAASRDKLISAVSRINKVNGEALALVARMMLAVDLGCPLDGLTDAESSVSVHFRDPSTPSLAATADAATKLVGAVPAFAYTDVFWERVGLDEAERRSVMGDVRRAQARLGASAMGALPKGAPQGEVGADGGAGG